MLASSRLVDKLLQTYAFRRLLKAHLYDTRLWHVLTYLLIARRGIMKLIRLHYVTLQLFRVA